MASTAPVPEVAAAPAAVKLPLMPLLLGGVVIVILVAGVIGGAVFFLVHTGRLPMGSTAAPTTVAAEAPVKAARAVATHPVVLETLLVNLADEDGHSYLRVGIVLAEADDPTAKKEAEAKPVAGANAAVRDTVLEVLGKQRSVDLLQMDGKEKLKKELKEALEDKCPEAEVREVYFTDFLVQR